VVGPDRKPLYDGYLYSGSPPWQVQINLFHGFKIPMSHPQLEQPYKDHATYVDRVRAIVSRLVSDRWLTAVDGAALVREARISAVPWGDAASSGRG